MAKKKSRHAEIADACKAILKACLHDLEIVGEGLATEDRHYALSNSLRDVEERLQEIDPIWIRIRQKERQKAEAAARPAAIAVRPVKQFTCESPTSAN